MTQDHERRREARSRFRVERYVEMAQMQEAHFNATRGIQWKVTLAIWAFFALAVQKAAELTAAVGEGTAVAVTVVAIVISVAHVAWMEKIQQSLDIDKHLMVEWRTRALWTMGETVPQLEQGLSRFQQSCKDAKWSIVQGAVTVALAAALCVFMFLARPPSKPEPVSVDGRFEVKVVK